MGGWANISGRWVGRKVAVLSPLKKLYKGKIQRWVDEFHPYIIFLRTQMWHPPLNFPLIWIFKGLRSGTYLPTQSPLKFAITGLKTCTHPPTFEFCPHIIFLRTQKWHPPTHLWISPLYNFLKDWEGAPTHPPLILPLYDFFKDSEVAPTHPHLNFALIYIF